MRLVFSCSVQFHKKTKVCLKCFVHGYRNILKHFENFCLAPHWKISWIFRRWILSPVQNWIATGALGQGLVKASRSSSACVFLARQDLDVTPWQLKPLHLPDYCYYFYHHYYRKLINVKQGPMEMFQINSEQKPIFWSVLCSPGKYSLKLNVPAFNSSLFISKFTCAGLFKRRFHLEKRNFKRDR